MGLKGTIVATKDEDAGFAEEALATVESFQYDVE